MDGKTNSNILFEMLRSFTTLSQTLNLSEAVRILGSTRQTVRRHIDILEKARNEKLFVLKNRQYTLTEAGLKSLPEAEIILARGNAWYSGQLESVKGLQAVKIDDHETQDAPVFYSQQHRLNRIWLDGTPLLQKGFRSWVKTKGSIESDEFASIRPFWLIFRRLEQGWVCAEIGEKSALATWFGWKWAKSSVGQIVEKIPAAEDYGEHILQSYNEVFESGAVRLDHQHRQVTREKNGPLVPISFQRLLLACTFPDGEPALMILADRTYRIQIDGLSESQILSMPKDLLMETDPEILQP